MYRQFTAFLAVCQRHRHRSAPDGTGWHRTAPGTTWTGTNRPDRPRPAQTGTDRHQPAPAPAQTGMDRTRPVHDRQRPARVFL
jgi:hypothetical protein